MPPPSFVSLLCDPGWISLLYPLLSAVWPPDSSLLTLPSSPSPICGASSGFPVATLFSVLRRYSAPVWHHMLCSGVSNHTMAPVLTFLQSDSASPLRGLVHWRVVTAFSGPDTFTACLRSLSPPQSYTLLAASDPQSCCRSAILAVHLPLQGGGGQKGGR